MTCDGEAQTTGRSRNDARQYAPSLGCMRGPYIQWDIHVNVTGGDGSSGLRCRLEGRWARAVRWYDTSHLTPWAFLEADCAARSCATCHARRGSCISSHTTPRADYPGCLLCTRNAGSCASHRQGTRHREGSVRTHKGIPSRPWRPPNREARAGGGDRMSRLGSLSRGITPMDNSTIIACTSR